MMLFLQQTDASMMMMIKMMRKHKKDAEWLRREGLYVAGTAAAALAYTWACANKQSREDSINRSNHETQRQILNNGSFDSLFSSWNEQEHVGGSHTDEFTYEDSNNNDENHDENNDAGLETESSSNAIYYSDNEEAEEASNEDKASDSNNNNSLMRIGQNVRYHDMNNSKGLIWSLWNRFTNYDRQPSSWASQRPLEQSQIQKRVAERRILLSAQREREALHRQRMNEFLSSQRKNSNNTDDDHKNVKEQATDGSLHLTERKHASGTSDWGWIRFTNVATAVGSAALTAAASTLMNSGGVIPGIM